MECVKVTCQQLFWREPHWSIHRVAVLASSDFPSQDPNPLLLSINQVLVNVTWAVL